MGKRKILIAGDELYIRELIISALEEDQLLAIELVPQICYFNGRV
jgi:hypothetical protein